MMSRHMQMFRKSFLIFFICIVASIDTYGLEWTQRDLGTEERLYSVAFGNSVYVVVGENGNVWHSTNALEWSQTNTGGGERFRRLRFLNGMFIATTFGPARILTSPDGVNWTTRYANNELVDGRGLHLWDIDSNGEGLIVAVGGIKFARGPGAPLIVRSEDGIAWSEAFVESDNEQFNSVAHNGNYFVALRGDGAAYFSIDGQTWTNDSFGVGPSSPNVNFVSGLFVATTSVGGFDGRTSIQTSTDGMNWTFQSLPEGSPNYLTEVAELDSQIFSSTGYGIVLVSDDATNWQVQQLPVDVWYDDVNECNGSIIMVGYQGTLVQSSSNTQPPDLSSWASAHGLIGPDANASAIPFGDGVENLLKYAFNMDGSGPDNRILRPHTGVSGLPVIHFEEVPAGRALRVEFIRRIGADLTYQPQISRTLEGDSWNNIESTPIVTQIDAEWDRVVVQELLSPDETKVFARVSVTVQ